MTHPNIITAIESVISGVVQTSDNKNTILWARTLLARFPEKMRLVCAEQRVEDKERLFQAAEDEIKVLLKTNEALRKTNEAQATENNGLKERIIELENPNSEHLELVKSAAELDRLAAPVVKVKLEPAVKSVAVLDSEPQFDWKSLGSGEICEPQSKKPKY